MTTETRTESNTGISSTGQQALPNILCSYFLESLNLREYNDDTSNLDFHRRYGLTLQVPEHWDVVSAATEVAALAHDAEGGAQSGRKKVLIIYSNSLSYKTAYASIGEIASYISWHEIHTAMQISVSDPSYMRRVRDLIGSSHLTILFDPPSSLPEVLNQIRAETPGCLIAIGSKP